MIHLAKSKKRFSLLSLALLELLTFTILLCIVWLNEINDYAQIYFGIDPEEPNIYRGYVLTGAVLICAVISIGCTHLHARHIIKGMLIICADCKKVKLNSESWADIDQYLYDVSLADLSHGMCPDCASKALGEMEADHNATR